METDTTSENRAGTARETWAARLAALRAEGGFLERLGAAHVALYRDAGPTLLVSFDTATTMLSGAVDRLPPGHGIAEEKGWSSLTLIATADTWFRDPALYAFFDRLVDDGFFEAFDRVVFFGAGMAGYAAAAYSVVAPGATVLLVAPQATLDPAVAGWDSRFVQQRRRCFTDRYGYAPDMIEGAGPVFLAYDPRESLDAMHAALFRRPFVTPLPCRGAGSGLAAMLDQAGITAEMLRLAGAGKFTARAFWRLWRARRDHAPYLRGLVAALGTRHQHWRAALVCRNVVARLQAPRFAARLAQLEGLLAADRRPLPPRRA